MEPLSNLNDENRKGFKLYRKTDSDPSYIDVDVDQPMSEVHSIVEALKQGIDQGWGIALLPDYVPSGRETQGLSFWEHYANEEYYMRMFREELRKHNQDLASQWDF